MAKVETTTIHPEAELEPRPTDLRVPINRLDLYAGMSLFAGLKPDAFQKFPGTGVVRRFRKGEVICRQGEAGWTAFYILSSEDALKLLRALPREDLSDEMRIDLDRETAAMERVVAGTVSETLPREAAAVYLSLPRAATAPARGWLGRLKATVFGARSPAAKPTPRSIPIDGPADLEYQSLRSTLHEDELFGEMSCFYRTPRSATIVADRDCYVLEMLRNILDNLKKDKKFKERLDRTYKERVLDLQIRNLPLFKNLREDQMQRIREKAELKSFRAGQVICDEHDRSDEMFLIRSGLIKVVQGVSALFTADDVGRWRIFPPPDQGPIGAVWQTLPDSVQALLRASTDFAALEASNRQTIAHALNTALKAGPLWKKKEFEAPARDVAFVNLLAELPDNAKDWPELSIRRLNRFLLETVLFGAATFRRTPELETVLAYRARGESIGEMGLMSGEPRSATCVAYIHPREGRARKEAARQDEELVETVHIPQELFNELKQDELFCRNVEEIIASRRRTDRETRQAPLGGEEPERSQEFAKLGLIQGQRLMLIDLDRCTRCDECVRACVNTHNDGRSRLFLDGPRFGQYLVPTTCRSCLDPVCMIGCPVGSIHRGDNGQIVIEDWCIGCNLCAKQCPYGAIQMHDIGMIPEGSRGWRYRALGSSDSADWTQPNFKDGNWSIGAAPFRMGPEFSDAAGRVYGFRFEFRVPPDLVNEDGDFVLELISPDPAAAIWINGSEIRTEEKLKGGKRPFVLAKTARVLRSGRNVVAARLTVPASDSVPFFDLRLDAIHKPNVPASLASLYAEKGVTEQAVVCDLCSTQWGQVPACVNACPHDAALRVNARLEFPTR